MSLQEGTRDVERTCWLPNGGLPTYWRNAYILEESIYSMERGKIRSGMGFEWWSRGEDRDKVHRAAVVVFVL